MKNLSLLKSNHQNSISVTGNTILASIGSKSWTSKSLFKTVLVLILFGTSFALVNAQPYIVNSEGLGQYGYVEKDASVTYFRLNSGSHGNIYQLFTRSWISSNILTYGTAVNSCAGSGIYQSTYNYNFGSLSAGNIIYSSVHADYCGGANSYGGNPNQVGFNERSFFVMDLVPKTDALVTNVCYNSASTNVILSFTIANNNVSSQVLNRLWITNDGTAVETTDIKNDAFELYYEAATGSEIFDGNESNITLLGNYNSNSTTDNTYGHDALGISIPQNTTGGLRCYVVLKGTATYLNSSATSKTVRLAIIPDGISITPNRDGSFSKLKMDITRPSSSYFTIVANSVGGTATATATTISVGSSTTINLSGSTGTIQWQQSPDGTNDWATVTGGSGGTTVTYTTPILTTTTYFRAVLTTVCSETNSTTETVTVDPINAVPMYNALQNETNPSTSIDLTWTKNAEGHNVMVVRKKIYQSWTEPTQGTAYTAGNSIGDGVVVYNSNGTSYTNTGLASSTDYEYKFYSVNNNYYSVGVTQNIYTAFAAGDGTIGSPFQVANADGLYCARHYTNTTMYGGNFIQTTDIDLSGVYAEGEGWLPIDDLQGSYNGQGHTISNLTINRPTGLYPQVGLFASVSTGVISNLGLTDVNIIGYYDVGSFAAKIRIGVELSSTVQMDKCYATGSVSVGAGGMGHYVGGLVGQLAAPISQCYSTCAVNNAYPNTHQYVGGLVGNANGGSLESFTNITNCYATGAVTAGNTITWAEIGGLVGGAVNNVNFQNCFASGLVTCSNENTWKDGLVGRCWGNAKSTGSFYDYQTTGQSPTSSWYPGETGKTTAEMKTAGTFLAANWDFSSTGAWGMNGTTNSGYPYLRFQGAASNHIWLGTSTTAWATAGNWSENAAPASDKVVIIPDVTNNPIISTAAEVTNLTIETGGVLTVEHPGSLTVSGTLSNVDGATGLIVKSDASGTGSLKHNTSDVNATFQRYMNNWTNADNGWHFISSPVGVQAIDPNFVTDPIENYDFYCWYEPSNLWVNYKNTTVAPTWATANGSETAFVVGKGYMAAYSAAETKLFSGALNVANVPVSGLTITGTTQANRSWHLLGNPFACAITWDATAAWATTNIAGVANIWNEAAQSYTPITSVPPMVIPATNGFMVQASGGTGSLTIPASKRDHSAQSFYKTSTTIPQITLIAKTADGTSEQISKVMVYADATEGFDLMYDGEFLAGFAPLFYSKLGDINLSVNCLPSLPSESMIPFGFVKNDATNFSIELKESMEGYEVFLKDLKTNTDQNLTENPVYTFTSEAGDDANRFLLHFLSTVGTTEPSSPEALQIYSNAGNIYVSGATGKADVYVMNMLGQTMIQSSVNGDGLKVINAENLPAGVYIVSVVNNLQTLSGKVIIK